jgi:transcriptional regulator with XRE-family HTH domain
MNIKLIREWIEKNEPQGIAKLAGKTEISVGTIHKILNGHEPGLDIARRLANEIGVSLDELAASDEAAS